MQPDTVCEAIVRLGVLHKATGSLKSEIHIADYPHHLIDAFADARDLEAMRCSPLVIRSMFSRQQRLGNPLNRLPLDLVDNIARFIDPPLNVPSLFREFYAHGGLRGVRPLDSDHKRARHFAQLVSEAVTLDQSGRACV